MKTRNSRESNVEVASVSRLVAFGLISSCVLWLTAAQRQATVSLRQARDGLKRNNQLLQAEIIEHKQAESELRKQKEILQTIFDHVPAMIVLQAKDGRIRLANPEFERMLGWRPDEITNQDFDILAEMYPDPQDRQKVLDFIARAEGRWEDFKTRTKEGQVIDTTWAKVRLSDDSIIGVGKDITERKRAEEALRRSEDHLRRVVNTIPAMVWSAQPDGSLDFINQRHREFTGLSLDDVGGWRWTAVIHPEDRPRVVDEWRRALAMGEALENEARLRRTAGDYRWLVIRAVPLRDESGEIVKWYGTKSDITKRKHAEEALRESETKLKQAQQIAKIGYWERDLIADRITWSEETCRIFGREPADNVLSQAQLQDLVHPDDRPLQQQALNEALQGSRLYDVEYRIVRSDGDMRFVHIRDEIVYDELGQPIRMFGTVQDITERKQAEEQIRLHAARMQVLAEMSRTLEEAGLDYSVVLDTVVRRTAELIGDMCALALFSDDGQREFPVAYYHRDPQKRAILLDRIQRQQSSIDASRHRAVMSGNSIYLPEVNPAEFRAAHDRELRDLVDAWGVASYVSVPLRVQGGVIGALDIIRDRGSVPYTRDDQVLLQDLADHAALTIQNARLFEQVQSANTRLQTLSNQLIIAQEAERRTIARELHDEIGQVLTAVSTDLQAVQHSRNPETRAARLEDSIALVDDALSRVRDLSLDLRPAMLDDLGLVSALEWYIERQAERSGFEPTFVAEPSEMHLSPSLETTVFRVAQIALTNVARHARAKQVWVELGQHANELELAIRDDGVGFDVPAALERAARGASMGLLSLQERVRLAHGELEIKSSLEQGTEIRARFPLS